MTLPWTKTYVQVGSKPIKNERAADFELEIMALAHELTWTLYADEIAKTFWPSDLSGQQSSMNIFQNSSYQTFFCVEISMANITPPLLNGADFKHMS